MHSIEELERSQASLFSREDDDFYASETFSQYSTRRERARQRRFPHLRTRPQENDEPISYAALFLKLVQLGVNLLFFLFFSTAFIGFFLSPKATGLDDDVLVVADAAFSTTWRALKLWTNLLWSVIFPATQFSREGMTALQPSIMATLKLIKSASPLVKGVITSVVVGGSLILYSLQQLKRRQVFTRAALAMYKPVDFFEYSFKRIQRRVGETSTIVGRLLPHIFFISLSGTVSYFFKNELVLSSKGLPGWIMVIGIPVLLSTIALTEYDQLYTDRVETAIRNSRRPSKRRPSFLPLENAEQGPTLWSRLKGIVTPAETPSSEPDLEFKPLFSYKTQRGIQPLQYPALLDTDQSSFEQFIELQTVLKWLKFWVVLAPILLVEALPIVSFVIGAIPYWEVCRCLFALWLYFPGTKGAALIFNLFGKILSGIAPVESKNAGSVAVLVGMLPLSSEYKQSLREITETGGTMVIYSVPFMFLPSFLTNIGASLLALVKPMFSASQAVSSIEKAALDASDRLAHKVTTKSAGTSVAGWGVVLTQWLEYWVVFAVVVLVVSYLDSFMWFVPCYAQAKLLTILWLQLPYFRGSRRIFKELVSLKYAIQRRIGGTVEELDDRSVVSRLEVEFDKISEEPENIEVDQGENLIQRIHTDATKLTLRSNDEDIQSEDEDLVLESDLRRRRRTSDASPISQKSEVSKVSVVRAKEPAPDAGNCVVQ